MECVTAKLLLIYSCDFPGEPRTCPWLALTDFGPTTADRTTSHVPWDPDPAPCPAEMPAVPVLPSPCSLLPACLLRWATARPSPVPTHCAARLPGISSHRNVQRKCNVKLLAWHEQAELGRSAIK